MSQRRTISTAIAGRYRRATKAADKGLILDVLCATTGWHRSHARKGARASCGPAPSRWPTGSRPRR